MIQINRVQDVEALFKLIELSNSEYSQSNTPEHELRMKLR